MIQKIKDILLGELVISAPLWAFVLIIALIGIGWIVIRKLDSMASDIIGKTRFK